MDVPTPDSSGSSLLTPREREVFDWAKIGKTSWAIGRILDCSEATVKKHLQHIYRKLGVGNRVEALNALRE